MSDSAHVPPTRALVRRLAHPLRRALAPAALELHGRTRVLGDELAGVRNELAGVRDELRGVRDEVGGLHAEVDRLRRETEELRVRAEAAEARLAAADGEQAYLRDGLEEARRLNLRVAELVDLVTELVLPLHDREIDRAALARLRPDTL